MDFLFEYGLFFAKAVTVVAVVLIIISSLTSFSAKSRLNNRGELKVTHLNDSINKVSHSLEESILSESENKEVKKQRKAEQKKLKISQLYKNRILLIDVNEDPKV